MIQLPFCLKSDYDNSTIDTAPCGAVAVREELNKKLSVVAAVALIRKVPDTPGFVADSVEVLFVTKSVCAAPFTCGVTPINPAKVTVAFTI